MLTASIEEVTTDTLAAFVARPADEPLRSSVVAVLEGLLDEPVFAQACLLERAADASPATRRFLREFSDGQVDAFEQGLRDRLGPDADPVYVATLAAASVAILDRVTRLLVREMPDADPDDPAVSRRYHTVIRQSFDLLFAGFDESAALHLPRARPHRPPGELTVASLLYRLGKFAAARRPLAFVISPVARRCSAAVGRGDARRLPAAPLHRRGPSCRTAEFASRWRDELGERASLSRAPAAPAAVVLEAEDADFSQAASATPSTAAAGQTGRTLPDVHRARSIPFATQARAGQQRRRPARRPPASSIEGREEHE